MAASKKKSDKDKDSGYQVLAKNRRARFDYEIDDTLEAGIVLTGTEVKSLRDGGASINESYAGEMEGELFLINANIPEYKHASPKAQHKPKRPRKLLVHKREMNKLMGALQRKGQTLVPMKLYFNKNGLVKLELGLGVGKKTRDKRDTIKDRDWSRDKARIMKQKNN